MKASTGISIAVLLMVFVLSACTDEAQSEEFVSYSQDIKPITEKACTGYCHQSWDHFTHYENLKEVVDNGKLEEMVVITKQMPYGPGEITEEERALFAQWIAEGGLDN